MDTDHVPGSNQLFLVLRLSVLQLCATAPERIKGEPIGNHILPSPGVRLDHGPSLKTFQVLQSKNRGHFTESGLKHKPIRG